MAKDRTIKVQSSCGMLWFIGWLFTLGFLKLGFWKGLIGLIIWPYYIGAWAATLGG